MSAANLHIFSDTANVLRQRLQCRPAARKARKDLAVTKVSLTFAPAFRNNWRVGRVIDRAGLEIRYTGLPYRGFESLTLRKISAPAELSAGALSFMPQLWAHEPHDGVSSGDAADAFRRLRGGRKDAADNSPGSDFYATFFDKTDNPFQRRFQDVTS